MKGDFSRDTFDRKKHYNAVLMQQGRVQVDADWNEQQAIHQNRIETEAIDVIGKCGAPKYNAGFGITSAGGQFRISAGRFYVAGILCENEADTLYSEQPDLPNPPDLGDLFSDADTEVGIIYLDVWKRHLIALDDPKIREVALGGPDTATRLKTIWQVKVLPVAGSDEDDLSCESEPPEWNDLIAPSTGTLNAQTAEPDTADNPCLIPPDAGYQRLENQLYRVEIHQGSNSGAVTFKWSRDNGSVVTEIQRMDGQEVTVADLGRDEVLGFARGQWVEILDDALELNGLPGELVEIDDLTTDAEGRPVIVLATTPTPLAPVAEFPDGVNPDRHPKLRRWDQSGTDATANGVPIGAGWISLEGNIQVQFSGGTYKTGDYWLIPARTATGQIEWFQTNDPIPVPIPQLPLGIRHHYCRLAIAQFFPGDDPEGNELGILEVCDHDFPPLTELDPGECCCTVVVPPGESIQAALDSLPPAGGCVCLKTGVHSISQPIRIEKSNVVLKGESPGARVVRNNGLNLVVIARLRNQLITDVVVEQIRFEAAGVETQAPDLLNLSLLAMGNCVNVRVQHCRFEVAEAEQEGRGDSTLPIAAALGMVVINSRQVALLENTLRLPLIGIWAEGCTDCKFSGNQLIAPVLRLSDRLTIPLGYAGILLNLFPSENLLLGNDCQISNNSIQDFWLGIVAGVRSDRCQILHNQIRRQAMNQLPIQEPNNQFLAGNEPYLYGIITYGSSGTIAHNFIELNSPSYGGIRAFGILNRIDNNTLQSGLTRDLLAGSSQLPLGIFLGQLQPAAPPGSVAPLPPLLLNYSVVKGNRLLGALTGIGAINAEGIEILDNQIGVADFVASLSTGVGLANTLNSVVSNNQIRGADLGIFLVGNFPTSGLNNRILNNHISDGGYGIGAVSETGLEVSGNFIENMTLAGFAATNLIENAYLTHNRMDHCGYQPPTSDLSNIAATPAIGAGIFIISVLGNLTLESCQIMNTGISRVGQITQGAAWGIAVGIVLACQITQNQVFYSDTVNLGQINLSQLHRSLLLVGWFVPTDDDLPYPQVGAALVTNNVFQGIGFPHLVEFLKNTNVPQVGFEQVNFSHNQCFHLRTQEQPSIGLTAIVARQGNATVSTWGRQLVVMGNQVKADNLKLTSIDLSNPERVTLMGNIATGAIINFEPGVTPANPRDFNVYP